tara:strand:- start:185 stop:859 length:675 start_codon:yes stop_codon:yes gene_type:complete
MNNINVSKLKTHKSIFSKESYIKRPALFLDRDGVIIEDEHYIKDVEKVKLCDGIIELISISNSYNVPVIVVTNQSGITRKIFDWKDYELVTQRMIDLLGKKAKISAIYANGYGPNEKTNNWRKPNPNMLIEAANELNIILNESIIIGDRLSDLIAGEKAGLKFLFHIKTGKGLEERDSINKYLRNNVFSTNINECYFNKKFLLFLNNLKEFPINILKTYYSNIY